MWIDAHIHLYDTRRTTVTWPTKDLPLPGHVYVPDFLAVAGGTGISRMVSVECTVDGPEEVDNWTLTLTRHDPAVAAVIACGDLTKEEFALRHERYLAFSKYRGIRMGSAPASMEFTEAQRLIDTNLCAMEASGGNVVELLQSPEEAWKLLPVIREHRDVRFVLDHIPGCTVGSGPQTGATEEFLTAMAAQDNVFMKVSSFVTKSPVKPAPAEPAFYDAAFRLCFNLFGAHRCMYGSDWPVLTFKGEYATAVRALTGWLKPLGTEITNRVMGKNCEEIYTADMEGV